MEKPASLLASSVGWLHANCCLGVVPGMSEQTKVRNHLGQSFLAQPKGTAGVS